MRILIKLSGELLSKNQDNKYYTLHNDSLFKVCTAIKEIKQGDNQIGIVIGGGNIFRGGRNEASKISRTSADEMGMLATVMNALGVSDVLKEQLGIKSKVLAPFLTLGAEMYSPRKAEEYLEDGFVNFYAGGTGHGFCTTDTACVLRACETKATLIKATTVDGVYDKDPNKYKDAIHYPEISYDEYLKLNLKLLDAGAIGMAREQGLPIMVCKASDNDIGNIVKVLKNDCKHTLIR